MNKNVKLAEANRQLSRLNQELKNSKIVKDLGLENSLADLVKSAFTQTNLTSFNPILQNNIYAPLTINWNLLMYMYKTHGIVQTLIDVPVLDGYRGGVEIISGEVDEDEIKEVEDDLLELAMEPFTHGSFWARLFGGGAVVMNVDGQDPSKPFDIEKLRMGQKVEFYDANRWELGAAHAASELFNFYGQNIHRSRLLMLKGKRAPYIIRWQLAGWGMSEIERIVEPFNMYLRQMNVIYELLEEAKVDVYRLANFNTQLGSAQGTRLTEKRVAMMNQLKNYNRALVMDMTDEYEQKQITFAGLADMTKETRIGLAANLRMPMTKLFGLSASGFNSGEDDIENYNAMVESEIRTPYKRPLKELIKILFMMRHGFIPEFDIKFKPLRVMGTKEEEEVNTSKQNRIFQIYDRGLADSEEVGQMLKKDKLTSVELKAEQGLLDPFPTSPGAMAMQEDGMGDKGSDKSKPPKKEKANGRGKEGRAATAKA